MENNQPRENIVGLAKETADKIAACAKGCAETVQSKAKEVSGVVADKATTFAKDAQSKAKDVVTSAKVKGKDLTYNALSAICGWKWLNKAEEAVVGALNRLSADRKEPEEESTARKEETIL